MKIFVRDEGTKDVHYFPEDDGYAPAGDESEVTDINDTFIKGLLLIGLPKLRHFRALRTRIDILVIAKTFAACTAGEKIIASECFVVDKADRDTVHNAAEQEANAEIIAGRIESDNSIATRDGLRDSTKDAGKSDVDKAVDVGSPIAIASKETAAIAAEAYEVFARQLINLGQKMFDGGVLCIDITHVDRDLSIKVTNGAGTETYGEVNGMNTSRTYEIPLSGLPLTGIENLKIHAKKDSAGGTDPVINQYVLYHGYAIKLL